MKNSKLTALASLTNKCEDTDFMDFLIRDVNNFLATYDREKFTYLGQVVQDNNLYTISFRSYEYGFGGRYIISILVEDTRNGVSYVQPFYQSSGINSGEPGRWLPFNGLWHKQLNTKAKELHEIFNGQYYFHHGWFRKAEVIKNGEDEDFGYDRIEVPVNFKISNLIAKYFLNKNLISFDSWMEDFKKKNEEFKNSKIV